MVRFLAFLFLAHIVLWVVALISCLSADEGDLRGLPRFAWVIIILLLPLIGSTAYLVAGRPVSTGPRSGVWRVGSGNPPAQRPPRPIAPDDDPDFLRSLRNPQRGKPKDDLPEG